jgi:hypothetical protein
MIDQRRHYHGTFNHRALRIVTAAPIHSSVGARRLQPYSDQSTSVPRALSVSENEQQFLDVQDRSIDPLHPAISNYAPGLISPVADTTTPPHDILPSCSCAQPPLG